MRVVLDASVAVHALIPGPLRAAAHARLAGMEAVAPALVDTEVLSALARLERGGALSTAEADAAALAWTQFPCDRLHDERLMARIWALRARLRVADAHYVAWANALDLPLLTADGRLARAVGPGTTVMLVQ